MKKYVLYGTGLEGEKLLYNYYNIKDEIAYCIDSFHKGKFHDIPIVTLDEAKNLHLYKIIVAAIWDTYEKIKYLLEEKGLVEYTDFFWASEFGKKLVVINANCHGVAVSKYLNRCSQFVKEYVIHPMPMIHINHDKEIKCNLLQRADVYIHQDIRPNNCINYKLSDEYVAKFLKDDCINITIPNFVGMGNWLYPTQGKVEKYITSPKGEVAVWYKDIVIDEAYKEKKFVSLEQYVTFYNSYMIEKEELEHMRERCLGKLREREKKWNIKVTDFIMNNFQKIPCFVDCDHPSRYLMYEVGRQVAMLLGIEDTNSIDYYEADLGLPTPILKCVQDYFGLKWEVPNDKQRNVFLGYQSECQTAHCGRRKPHFDFGASASSTAQSCG